MAETAQSVPPPLDEYQETEGDDFAYNGVQIDEEDMVSLAGGGGVDGDGTLGGDGDGISPEEEDLEALRRKVQSQKERDAPPQVRADLTRLPEVVDDFVRNFFVKHGLGKTLEAFELEWYERYGANPEEDSPLVPDVYLENARLIERVDHLESELVKHKNISLKATTLWEKVKKERDLHRTNHNRVAQEKSKVTRDLKRLQQHAASIEPTVAELRQKYEMCQKEKMLLMLERDKLVARVSSLEASLRDLEGQPKEAANTAKGSKKDGAAASSVWPADDRPNPYAHTNVKAPTNIVGWSCRTSFKAHAMSVTGVALHTKKPVVATSSDDGTWRLFSLPQGELVMSGEGHKDWISSVAMHPKGTMIATGSGDKTVKLWDFAAHGCKSTITTHTEGIWSLQFNDTGDLLASGSLDKTARIFDIATSKCRQTLRGHVDAVNSVCWQPYSNIVCTGSGDKTVSLWDARANYCVQTFLGHHNAVTSVAMPLRGDCIASCDADGTTIVWDLKMIQQRKNFSLGPHPANCVAWEKSGSVLAVASDDSTIKLCSLKEDKVYLLKGHDDAVQSIMFDPATNGFLVSAGSDATVRYWS